MNENLERLLRPKALAVIGGGIWCRSVIAQCQKIGYKGNIWPVYPTKDQIAGLPAFKNVRDLPAAPDASFIGVNRFATIDIIQALKEKGAGGAVCFASGFRETGGEDGNSLHDQLIEASGDMAILGPNCYGFLNYLDGALLWPDQHGGEIVQSGVAILTQSSNIAINLTMQARGLPLAYIITTGNQARVDLAQIAEQVAEDPRVTAIGCHIEGFGDLEAYESLSRTARNLGKPVVILKVGQSSQAQTATISHTASLAGSDAGADALIRRLGFGRAKSIPDLLETLKLLHVTGPLENTQVSCLSCSGGEASLSADTGMAKGITFPPLTDAQDQQLASVLGPLVARANPLDYHTDIWRNEAAMTQVFSTMAVEHVSMTTIVLDFPRMDRCDAAEWDIAIDAIENAAKLTGRRFAVVASMPENLPEPICKRLVNSGITPFLGLDEAFAAIQIAGTLGQSSNPDPVLKTGASSSTGRTLSEDASKQALAEKALATPKRVSATTPELAGQAADCIGYPMVVKGEGIARKSDRGAVALNLVDRNSVIDAASAMPTERFLVEEMITDGIAELLIGIVRDEAHGFVLTIAAGGIYTEILSDRTSLLVPSRREDILEALNSLKIAPVLHGFRGKPGISMDAVIDAVMALQNYTVENANHLLEVEVNPLVCTTDRAVAVDALIRMEE